MPNELIRVENGRASLSDAVIRVAHVLNPLGVAANIVATLGACVIEIRRFRLLAQDVRAGHAVASDIIRTRQGAIIGLFEARMRDSESMRVSLQDLHLVYKEMAHQACNMSISASEREVTQGTITILSDHIVRSHVEAGNSLVRLSDSLRLGDTEVAIRAWHALER